MSKIFAGLSPLCAVAAMAWASGVAAQTTQPPADAPTLAAAIAGGQPILQIRARYEDVDQANFKTSAQAYTVRTHLGWQTGAWNGLSGLIELSNVQGIGVEHYNTTVNGKTGYPTIADPDQSRLNRVQLTWAATTWLSATVGRQRITLDDQRFVGNVDWRQNEQVFDAARVDVKLGKLQAGYAYIDQVNRVFGDTLNWRGNTNLVWAAYSLAAPLKVQGFDYSLDFTTNTAAARAASVQIAGLKATGQVKAAPVALAYGVTYAEERNFGANPAHFRLSYKEADLAAAIGIVTVKAEYEQLQGNGHVGFATPLATIHPLDGWDDVFLTTPVKGLTDESLSLAVKPPVKLAYLFNTVLFARYHAFSTQMGGQGLGHEWDLQATGQFSAHISGLVKYADYSGVVGTPSRTKVWVGLEYKF